MYSNRCHSILCAPGGNGSGQGNETEDEDHEFFDAVEEGVSTNMEDTNSFVIKVPVSPLLTFNLREHQHDSSILNAYCFYSLLLERSKVKLILFKYKTSLHDKT